MDNTNKVTLLTRRMTEIEEFLANGDIFHTKEEELYHEKLMIEEELERIRSSA